MLWMRLTGRSASKRTEKAKADIPVEDIPVDLPPSSPPRQTVRIKMPAPMRDPSPQVPLARAKTVNEMMREEAHLRRTYGPSIKPAAPGTELGDDLPEIWKIDERKHENFIPLAVIKHTESEFYAIVLSVGTKSWLFWTGPRNKMFTTMDRGPVWTTKNRRIAAVTAAFLQQSAKARLQEIRSSGE